MAPARFILVVLAVLLLLLTVGAPLQLWRVWPGVVLTELFVILLPTMLFARKTGSTEWRLVH